MRNNYTFIKFGRSFKIYILLSFVSFIVQCDNRESLTVPETILVRIGDKTISKNEFLRRAEYTIRPKHCKGNYTVHKKIILNSLVAEKLFAIEYGDSVSREAEEMLLGRKEQAMRLFLYDQVATSKIEIDSIYIANILKNSQRKYEISFLSINDSIKVDRIWDSLSVSDENFDDFFKKRGMKEIPKRKVEWIFGENNILLDSLFYKGRETNEIIGPIKISNNHFMIINVDGFTEQRVLTDAQLTERWKKIYDRMESRRSKELYDDFIVDLMKGKTIQFNKESFFSLVNLLGPIYMKSSKQKNLSVERMYYGEIQEFKPLKSTGKKIEDLDNLILLKVDEEEWTVGEIFNYMKKHPLVFRQKKMNPDEFGHNLQDAIIDMITDYHVTKEGYRRNYDKVNVVQREYDVWKDNLCFIKQRNKLMREKISTGSIQNINQAMIYLNPIIKELQEKYSHQIEWNGEVFKSIKLSRIDMEVIQPSQAFQKTVPGFPVITDMHSMEYGKGMKLK